MFHMDKDTKNEPIIIWLDGTYGVGKSTVAEAIKENCPQIEILDSDDYWLKKIPFTGGGFFPQINKGFSIRFKNVIEDRIVSGCKQLLVNMALTDDVCKKWLFDPLQESYKNMFHIILMASDDVLKSRIMNDTDSNRDVHLAMRELESNIDFLANNYSDAVRICTDNKSVSDTADEILAVCGLGDVPES